MTVSELEEALVGANPDSDVLVWINDQQARGIRSIRFDVHGESCQIELAVPYSSDANRPFSSRTSRRPPLNMKFGKNNGNRFYPM